MKSLAIILSIFFAFGAVHVSAQQNLTGNYGYRQKIDDGRHRLDLIFELKVGNIAVYRNVQEGHETQKRFGTWTWNKKANRVTVTLPPVKDNPMQGQEIRLTFVFQVLGPDLKLIRDLPYKTGNGEIYRRQNR